MKYWVTEEKCGILGIVKVNHFDSMVCPNCIYNEYDNGSYICKFRQILNCEQRNAKYFRHKDDLLFAESFEDMQKEIKEDDENLLKLARELNVHWSIIDPNTMKIKETYTKCYGECKEYALEEKGV